MFNTFSIHSNTSFIVKDFICYFYRNSLNWFNKSLQRSDRTQRALQLRCTSNLHHMVESYWKIHLKIFSYTFPIHFDFDFIFTFSFWKSCTFWADGFNSNVVQLDETFHLIYILGVVQGVSSTSPSAVQLKVVSKNWLWIRTQGPRLPPGRSRKVKNLTMNN